MVINVVEQNEYDKKTIEEDGVRVYFIHLKILKSALPLQSIPMYSLKKLRRDILYPIIQSQCNMFPW